MTKHTKEESIFHRVLSLKDQWNEYKWLSYKKRYARLYENINQKSNEDIYCMIAYYEERINTNILHSQGSGVIIFIGSMAVTLGIGMMSTNLGALQDAVTVELSLVSNLPFEDEQIIQAVNIAADTNMKIMELVAKTTEALFRYTAFIALLAIGVMARPILAYDRLKKQVCERIFNERIAGGLIKKDDWSASTRLGRKNNSDNNFVLKQRRRRNYK